MDKYEYKLKLEQLKNLVDEKKYQTAADIADTINWRKVKSAATLCMVGEIYDRCKRYEESHEILLMAYDRAAVGRNILYRLTLVALKMGNLDEAKDYFEEFLEVAPYDNQKYILRYQIEKMSGANLQQLIEILEEFKEREYREEWVFELAYLYHRAGNSERCVEVCDELVLFIGDGKYVEKALELKMLYQPLNATQEAKYREFVRRREDVVEVHPTDALESGEVVRETIKIPNITANTGRFNTQNLQAEIAKSMQQIMDANTKETVNDTMDNLKKMVEDIPYLQVAQDEADRAVEDERYGHIETDEEIDDTLKNDFAELLAEDWDGQIRLSVPGGGVREPQVNGQIGIEEVLAEWERTRMAAETAMAAAQQKRLESAKARAMQEAWDLLERLHDIIPKLEAGVSPKELLEEQYLQNMPVEEQVEMAPEQMPEGVQMPDEISAYEEEQAPENIQIPRGMEMPEDIQIPQGVPLPEEAVMPEEMQYTGEAPLPEEMQYTGETPLPEEVQYTGEVPLPEDMQVSQETAQPKDMQIPEEVPLPEDIQNPQETVQREDIRVSQVTQELPELKSVQNPDIAKKPEDMQVLQETAQPKDMQKSDIAGEPEDRKDPQKTAQPEDMQLPQEVPLPEDIQDSMDVASDWKETAKILGEPIPEEYLQKLKQQEAAGQKEPGKEPKAKKDGTKPVSKNDAGQYLQSVFEAAKASREEKVNIPKIEIEEPEEHISKLSPEQKEIFSYFVPVSGMEQQLCQVLEGALHRKGNDNTSSSGNILITGGRGSGKTVLATDLIKVLEKNSKHPGGKAGKVGKITGEALNQKELSQLLKKVAGGYLIVEKAGDISSQTATKLSLLMEQNTDGLLVIMEDTGSGIRKFLDQDANLAKKFTERIKIPVFTSDELVEFAKAYAEEQECEIDDMGILALYNRISNIQKLDEATTLTEVKEIVDDAIASAERGGLKKIFGGKKFNPDGYLYLREKDFED